TRLTATNVLVLENGELRIGTAANPVAAGVSAQVVFVDTPLNTATDPQQYGHGLIGLGTVTMHGAALSQTFVALAAEAHAGGTTLQLSQSVTGWAVGDKIVLPDPQQFPDTPLPQNGYSPQWENATIAAISGTTITLAAPLQYSHLGARDAYGVLDYLPHV